MAGGNCGGGVALFFFFFSIYYNNMYTSIRTKLYTSYILLIVLRRLLSYYSCS